MGSRSYSSVKPLEKKSFVQRGFKWTLPLWFTLTLGWFATSWVPAVRETINHFNAGFGSTLEMVAWYAFISIFCLIGLFVVRVILRPSRKKAQEKLAQITVNELVSSRKLTVTPLYNFEKNPPLLGSWQEPDKPTSPANPICSQCGNMSDHSASVCTRCYVDWRDNPLASKKLILRETPYAFVREDGSILHRTNSKGPK